MKSKGLVRKLKFLKSMGFGIFLLMCILILSTIGTVIPQGRTLQHYAANYSEYIAELIVFFGLDHIYTSFLFAVLFGGLALNLMLCSTTRLGRIISQVQKRFELQHMRQIGRCKLIGTEEHPKALEYIFKGYGAAGILKYRHRNGVYLSSKNVLGYFGSWFLHLGIMLVILAYIYGQATFYSGEIYGVPGEKMSLKGTDYEAAIEAFKVSYRNDGSIEQYTTRLKLSDHKGSLLKTGSLNVNNPMRYEGYSFYQTSTGWAAECRTFKDSKMLKDEILYERSSSSVPEENIAIALTKFYPDFAASDQGFSTLSDQPNNPALLYAVYYRNELVKMDIVRPGEAIVWNEYRFIIDNFKRYTYIAVNRMRGQLWAAAGGALIMLGLALTFYFKPVELAVKNHLDELHIYGRGNISELKSMVDAGIRIDNYFNIKEEGINVR